MNKELMFMHDGQHYFIQLPQSIAEDADDEWTVFLKTLKNQGVTQVYFVYEDVRGRYLTILLNQAIPQNCLEKLPKTAEFRQNGSHPYILFQQTIITYDPDWMEIVDSKWKNHLENN
jgi:hypothetical protein